MGTQGVKEMEATEEGAAGATPQANPAALDATQSPAHSSAPCETLLLLQAPLK